MKMKLIDGVYQILVYRTEYTIKQKRIKEFICNFIQHLSYVFGRSEGTIAFLFLADFYNRTRKSFCECGHLRKGSGVFVFL